MYPVLIWFSCPLKECPLIGSRNASHTLQECVCVNTFLEMSHTPDPDHDHI